LLQQGRGQYCKQKPQARQRAEDKKENCKGKENYKSLSELDIMTNDKQQTTNNN